MKYRVHLAFCLLVASSTAPAHNVLPGVDWCTNGNAVEISRIYFGGGDTKRYQQCIDQKRLQPFCYLTHHVVAARPCPAQTCGDFDDDYRGARQLAHNYCNDLPALTDPESPYFGLEAVPIFTGPESLTDSATHHSSYDINDGVYGACMVCLPSND
ncbi:MAG: hypothetical protein JNN30_19950 [Rhodanobacteraceae bacterium]|nr:hypothetical protein [Rhodanobacteraceae bacterium]